LLPEHPERHEAKAMTTNILLALIAGSVYLIGIQICRVVHAIQETNRLIAREMERTREEEEVE